MVQEMLMHHMKLWEYFKSLINNNYNTTKWVSNLEFESFITYGWFVGLIDECWWQLTSQYSVWHVWHYWHVSHVSQVWPGPHGPSSANSLSALDIVNNQEILELGRVVSPCLQVSISQVSTIKTNLNLDLLIWDMTHNNNRDPQNQLYNINTTEQNSNVK